MVIVGCLFFVFKAVVTALMGESQKTNEALDGSVDMSIADALPDWVN